MIEQIAIEHFKSIRKAEFVTKPLTVLSGTNSAGKSSLLQSLMMMNWLEKHQTDYLPLSELEGLSLGQCQDALCAKAATTDITFSATRDGHCFSWVFDAAEPENPFLTVTQKPEAPNPDQRLFGDFFFLDSERHGPRASYRVESKPLEQLGVGFRGEFAPYLLAINERATVRESLCHPEALRSRGDRWLKHQVEHWMGEFVPKIEFQSDLIPGTDRVRLSLKHAGVDSEWIQPANAGFGICYTLPIVVAGMLTQPGTVLIVQNPEAHLHPRAQSRMGYFLAHLAASGAQVFVETHSDHLLNGIRLSVAGAKAPIAHDQVIFHFLTMANAETHPITIDINAKGELSEWPDGFFDQTEKDLNHLFRTQIHG
ncbi:AAA family ATPase [Acanthopleuribacter pedis]|uniref:DUF3696 domain-containing protein n=1 Tax=Acanthopleuribacter pedis TaxID=442870 RepID=A0A8J7Q9E7_9BACT|nr:DUF3696 domain-containing protein [Acanthopleuribacter pedis]MBO1319854.1 DUF3696 domain-containing protein [Acanthopleuribacter pedis]